VRPFVVDATRLDELAQCLVTAERRARDASTDLEAAASAVSAGWLGGGARPVGWALRLRERVLQAVVSLAAVVLVVARGYHETERQVCQQIDELLPQLPSLAPAGVGAPLLDEAASWWHAGSGPASDSWWAPAERLLAGLPPALLEGLLTGTPALARLVVEREPVAVDVPEGSTAGVVAGALRQAALLGPQQAAALVASRLATLDPGARRTVALLHPRLMTAAVAAPMRDRFAASRVLVAADLAGLHEQRRSATAQEVGRLDRRSAWEQRLLDETVVLQHPDGTVTRHPHQLLQFDPAGDGRIVEVVGDVRQARHLAVFVPGTGSDLDRYPGTFARMTPFAAARSDLAVVVWQGADHPDQPFDDGAPSVGELVRSAWDDQDDPGESARRARAWAREHVLAAGLRDAADTAGPALARDVAGLRAAAPGPASDLTVLGHSYGGSIVGAAELHGMTTDRVVHIASAGAYVDDVGDYPASAARTQRFSMTAYDDPIRLSQGHDMTDAGPRLRQLLPPVLDPLTLGPPQLAAEAFGPAPQVGHGLDPDLLPGVVRLDTGVHDDGSLVSGHSGMFTEHSTAWRNLLAVMTRGRVEVLEPQRWASHLEPLRLATVRVAPGHPAVPAHAPRYVVDRSPYSDPHYSPPVLDLGAGR
jgi:hypothetical protein